MVFSADKRSSTHHTHSLAALISALVSSQLPSSNRIAVLKIISSQAQVILLFLTDPILLLCAHVHNFTVRVCSVQRTICNFFNWKCHYYAGYSFLITKMDLTPLRAVPLWNTSSPVEVPFNYGLWTGTSKPLFLCQGRSDLIHNQKASLTFQVLIRGDLDWFGAAIHPVYLTGSQECICTSLQSDYYRQLAFESPYYYFQAKSSEDHIAPLLQDQEI